MIVDHLEMILLGARMADPKLRELLPNELFTGELAEIVNAPNGQQSSFLWKWLKSKGIDRCGEEKPLDAIGRTMADNRDRRKLAAEAMEGVRSLTKGAVTRAQLQEIWDKLHGRSEPEVTPIVSLEK